MGLHLLEGDEGAQLNLFTGRRFVQLRDGSFRPLGKAILAFYPDERALTLLQLRANRALHPNTIVSDGVMMMELRFVRTCSDAVDSEEHELLQGVKRATASRAAGVRAAS